MKGCENKSFIIMKKLFLALEKSPIMIVLKYTNLLQYNCDKCRICCAYTHSSVYVVRGSTAHH